MSFCRNPASQKALRASSTRRFLLLVLRQKSYGKIRKLFLNSSLVARVFDFVVDKSPNLFAADGEINKAKIKWYRQILRLIALIHDLGHPPFSHAGEELMPNKKKHEDYTKEIIKTPEIKNIIASIGHSLHNKLMRELGISLETLEKNKISPITSDLLWMIYGEKPGTAEEYIYPDFLFLKSFMDGELDCDKMDYLLRDSHYCGVTYGTYDLNRFISALVPYQDKENNTLELAINSGGVQAFEEFVLARYFMFIQVYFHRTRRHLDRLLVMAMKDILAKGELPTHVDCYLQWDDVRSIQAMKSRGTENTNNFISRKIMHCIYETPAHAKKQREYRSVRAKIEELII